MCFEVSNLSMRFQVVNLVVIVVDSVLLMWYMQIHLFIQVIYAIRTMLMATIKFRLHYHLLKRTLPILHC